MIINAIQGTENNAAAERTADVKKTEEFSSYLQTTASLEEIFTQASETYGVPKDLIKAIAKTESDFRPDATSGAGAQGIMQLMPATARELGVTDSYDPYQNIMGGTKYIKQMLDQFDGDVTLALAAYNAGANNVTKYGGVPPFEETQNYVVKVANYMNDGVSVPYAQYSAKNVSAASVEEAQDTFYQSILDQLFSYEDYLKFIELYTKMQQAQQDQNEDEQTKQKNQSDSIYSYQEFKYNPAVMNLMNHNL